jgi:hypothetical protein
MAARAVSYPVMTFGGEVRRVAPADHRRSVGRYPCRACCRLTALEVSNIIAAAANRARTTRAGHPAAARTVRRRCSSPSSTIQTPTACRRRARHILHVANATRFSWDVAVQKARTAVFFSAAFFQERTAPTRTRTVGFLAQSLYPPGIDGTEPGIFFGLQERFSIITPT